MKSLLIAAGGGGDAVGALLARRLIANDEEGLALIGTCAWERLIVDPVPGPRSPSGFVRLGPHNEVLADSDTDPVGLSMLPRLAAESGARIFLLDLAGGARGLAAELRALVGATGADRIVVVDVGGDAVAEGTEAALLSPTCDSLSVAAAVLSGIPCILAVVGPGSDGELTEHEVLARLTDLDAVPIGSIEATDAMRLEPILGWHPTEASSIVAAAAKGLRVRVAMRRGGPPRATSAHTAEVWLVDIDRGRLPLADVVSGTTSLDEAAELIGTHAVNELAYERDKARSTGGQNVPNIEALVDDIRRGATHVTLRRARELTGEAVPIGTFGDVVLEQTTIGLLQISLSDSIRDRP